MKYQNKMNHWGKITKCTNCGIEIEDKDNDRLKMCYDCAMEWMSQQWGDKGK